MRIYRCERSHAEDGVCVFDRCRNAGGAIPEPCEWHPGMFLADGECAECAAAFDLSRDACFHGVSYGRPCGECVIDRAEEDE